MTRRIGALCLALAAPIAAGQQEMQQVPQPEGQPWSQMGNFQTYLRKYLPPNDYNKYVSKWSGDKEGGNGEAAVAPAATDLLAMPSPAADDQSNQQPATATDGDAKKSSANVQSGGPKSAAKEGGTGKAAAPASTGDVAAEPAAADRSAPPASAEAPLTNRSATAAASAEDLMQRLQSLGVHLRHSTEDASGIEEAAASPVKDALEKVALQHSAMAEAMRHLTNCSMSLDACAHHAMAAVNGFRRAELESLKARTEEARAAVREAAKHTQHSVRHLARQARRSTDRMHGPRGAADKLDRLAEAAASEAERRTEDLARRRDDALQRQLAKAEGEARLKAEARRQEILAWLAKAKRQSAGKTAAAQEASASKSGSDVGPSEVPPKGHSDAASSKAPASKGHSDAPPSVATASEDHSDAAPSAAPASKGDSKAVSSEAPKEESKEDASRSKQDEAKAAAFLARTAGASQDLAATVRDHSEIPLALVLFAACSMLALAVVQHTRQRVIAMPQRVLG